MKYTVKYENPTNQYIHIEAIFDVSVDNFVELQFPVWRPGRYERGDFAKNLHSFKVSDDTGKKIVSYKITKDRWKVNCEKTKSIKVTYQYYAADLNAGSTYMDDQQLYMNPVNCLIYLEHQQENSCELTLEIPSNFRIACGQNFKNNKAIFCNYHELVDSPFIASATLKHLEFDCQKTHFNLWFQGECKLDEEKIIKDFQAYTNSQISKFGAFPVKEYHYLYQILPIPAYHGVEHQTSTVCALGPSYALMTTLYDDMLGVSSHELYHTWNVKAIRPAEMYPYDYSQENYSRQGYVTEGVTTYMGDLFLIESKVRGWAWYKVELEKLLQRHFDNFGRFNMAVSDASFDTWLDGYQAGVPNRKVSIYNEGSLLSLTLDLKIRTNTQNKASLHDVMKALYENFALKNKGYTEKDFQATVEAFAQTDLSDIFDNYYYGTHSFEPLITGALELVGLQIKMQPSPAYSTSLLGIKTVIENDKTLVKKLYPGSSADLGQLMLEDEILIVNGYKVNNDLDSWIEYFKDDQIELTVSRKGRVVNVICPNTNKSYFPIYTIEKAKSPSNLQKRVFKKWCSCDWDEI